MSLSLVQDVAAVIYLSFMAYDLGRSWEPCTSTIYARPGAEPHNTYLRLGHGWMCNNDKVSPKGSAVPDGSVEVKINAMVVNPNP